MIPDSITPLVGWRAWHLSWADCDPYAVAPRLRGRVGRAELERHGQLGLALDVAPAPGDLCLTSIAMEQRWPPLGVFKADCEVESGEPHEAPSEGCGCGVWAFAFPDVAWETINEAHYLTEPVCDLGGGAPVPVFGKVALWGRVVLCEQGYRSEFAYPRELSVIVDCPWLGGGEREAREAAEHLQSYRVPVEVMRWQEVDTVRWRP